MPATKTLNPANTWAARTLPSRPVMPHLLFSVGGHLHADHAVGIGHRLALLDLVDRLHAREHFANHGVLAVEEGAIGIHDKELRIRRVRIARARHPDNAA